MTLTSGPPYDGTMRALYPFVVLVSACSFSPAAALPRPDAAPPTATHDASPPQSTGDAAGSGSTACAALPGLAVYNGHHYFATPFAATWQDAEQACEAPGGHLVKIDDAAENAFIDSTFHPTSYLWTGLTDNDGSFAWTDGTAPTYTNFAEQPDVDGSSCVELDHGGSWSVYQCTQPHVGICECE